MDFCEKGAYILIICSSLNCFFSVKARMNALVEVNGNMTTETKIQHLTQSPVYRKYLKCFQAKLLG